MRTQFSLATLASTIVLLSACGGGSSGGGIVTDITIPFVARANSTDISCDADLVGLGTDAASGNITAFALYIHDVVLLNSDGSELPLTLADNDWQSSGVALLDYQDKIDNCASDTSKPTNTSISGSVDGGIENVTGIRFTIGVPEDLNHDDASAAELPLNRTDLFWSWQSGYKHARMDIAPAGGVMKPDNTTVSNWNVHLGSTGCTGDAQSGEIVSCSANNRPTIELDNIDLNSQHIVIDYGKLVENSSLYTDNGGAPGCMSGATDPECPDVFDALGMGLGEDADPTAGQTVFSVETF
ncbi:Uncharacterised protein [Zhongshania aliphaticivorans]|uniref:Copper-binding protein MbnP-like domain-containing protein n=1 Tax=Zhongshania aliphaticivorans TaxID=1470434 RepID=A0A5S9P3K9_9GAMM|nr:MbnP family copper-binding protein [Zhongshania aliphaticivorans]CAA0090328.1 Uncharacterised protein [Zhongshania aliphaticivorans]CAA0097755.1 Uncharacterised protein [Zhongshania aliphaticivorans]